MTDHLVDAQSQLVPEKLGHRAAAGGSRDGRSSRVAGVSYRPLFHRYRP